jgi:hypothetical protein
VLFSRFPSAQSASEMRFDNLFLVDLPVVEFSDLGCNFPVVGNPLGNVDCLPGTQVPRGFYLIEFKLNCSPTLEGENWTQDRQLALPVSWFTSLSAMRACRQKLVCAVRGFASWQSQQRRQGSPYGPPTSLTVHSRAGLGATPSGALRRVRMDLRWHHAEVLRRHAMDIANGSELARRKLKRLWRRTFWQRRCY